MKDRICRQWRRDTYPSLASRTARIINAGSGTQFRCVHISAGLSMHHRRTYLCSTRQMLHALRLQASSGWELQHGYIESVTAALPSLAAGGGGGAPAAADAGPYIQADHVFIKLVPQRERSAAGAEGNASSGSGKAAGKAPGPAPPPAPAGGAMAMEGLDAGTAPIVDSIQRIAGVAPALLCYCCWLGVVVIACLLLISLASWTASSASRVRRQRCLLLSPLFRPAGHDCRSSDA